jgi:hypothetical protein
MKIGRPESVFKNADVKVKKDERKEKYEEKLLAKLLPNLGLKERNLINSRQLKMVRYSAAMVFFEVDRIQRIQHMDFEKAIYWYRTMTEKHFEYLRTNKKVNIEGEKDYGGIAPFFSYCAKPEYFGNRKNGTHIVEFELDTNGKGLCEQIRAREIKKPGLVNFVHRDPKPENGAVSIGLGPKGYYAGTAGEVFNEKLLKGDITWRLVKFRVANPLPNDPLYDSDGRNAD